MFEGLTLTDIPKKQCGILREATNTRPIVWRIEENGVKAIVKDFSYNGFWFRNIVGRFLIWREKKAYNRLKGLSGIPVLFGSIGGIALILEEIEGRDIASIGAGDTLDENFLEDVKKLIYSFHENGIVHCDLKRLPNIIRADDGSPFIIDWAASISRSEFRLFPLNLIYNRFLQDDLNAITKIKLKYWPETVSPEEMLRFTSRSRAERIVRAIRDRLRSFIQKVA